MFIMAIKLIKTRVRTLKYILKWMIKQEIAKCINNNLVIGKNLLKIRLIIQITNLKAILICIMIILIL